MLKHSDIWRAIDKLAESRGLTASGLARRSGLDPTTFNKSKRITRNGKPRWPSTESLAKILSATSSDIDEFVRHLGAGGNGGGFRIPVIGLAQAGEAGYFDDAGYPTSTGWDEISFPDIGDPNAYSLEVSGDSMEPVYRDGDAIIVSPSSNIRRGDRVVLKTVDGEVMAKQLVRRTAHKVELQSLNADHPDRTIPARDVAWIARIVWVSQ